MRGLKYLLPKPLCGGATEGSWLLPWPKDGRMPKPAAGSWLLRCSMESKVSLRMPDAAEALMPKAPAAMPGVGDT